MAIAYDNSSQGSSAAPASSLTFSHTCTGSNLLLWVFIFTSDGTTGDKISGVTYNSVAMTRATGATNQDFASGQSNYAYYLAAPATGANNVVVTASESITDGIYATAQSYTGCSQTGIPDAATTSTTGGTITVTTVADNCWLAGGGRNISSGGLTASTGTIERQEVTGLLSSGDSNGAKTPAGSNSMVWTPDNANTKLFMVSFAPYVAPSGPANLKTFNGVAKASIKTINGVAIASVKTVDGVA